MVSLRERLKLVASAAGKMEDRIFLLDICVSSFFEIASLVSRLLLANTSFIDTENAAA